MDAGLSESELVADSGERSPVFDFDFYVDERFATAGDQHSALRELQQVAPPIFWSPAQGGYWMIQGHELTSEAARSTDLFSSRAMNIPADDRELDMPPAIPIMLDPPTHALYREPLSRLFGPQRMASMEGKIRKLAIDLIDTVKADGRCDFVKAVGEPLPVLTFMDLMGFEHDRLEEFRYLAVAGSVDPDQTVKQTAAARIGEIMSDFVDERLADADHDADDMTAKLLKLTIDGRPITPDEAKSYCRLLFFAGLDTVVNAMAFGISYLARHPEIQKRAREVITTNSKLVAEELLRLGSPAIPGRMVTRDTVWHGATLRKGDRAILGLAAANLDAAAFPEPMAFDPERPSIAHLGFNAGPHRCVGQHLARIELRVFYEEWLARIPSFTLDPDSPPKMHGGMVMGVDLLPIVWKPAAAN